MQVSFMRMQMQMYVFVMYEFAPAWICRCKCNPMMVQMVNSSFAKSCNEILNVHEYWFKHLHHMHNICICIFLEDICKIRNFHLHHHLVAFTFTISCWGKSMHHKAYTSQSIYICICILMKDTCITSTYICICILIKDTCITRNFHLHHHMAAFMSAYQIRIFALDIP